MAFHLCWMTRPCCAFAGQAAVAIENARLYTLTDQERRRPRGELSVMQRIDRELNASLEMDAPYASPDWALRQSGAGGIDRHVGEKLRVMSYVGFDDYIASLPDQTMKVELPAMSGLWIRVCWQLTVAASKTSR